MRALSNGRKFNEAVKLAQVQLAHPAVGSGSRWAQLAVSANNLQHPLAAVGSRMPRPWITAALALLRAHRDRQGPRTEGTDLFGARLAVAGVGVSPAERPH